jgi:hypothetical protein
MLVLHISKLDAARRQLETATRLYFHQGDPVSTHSLMAAAYEILHDISIAAGRPITMKATLPEYLRPGYVKVFHKQLTEAQNFFKHAKRDSASTLAFDPRQTELLLLDAVRAYRVVTGESVPLFATYEYWLALQDPELFIEPQLADRLRQQFSDLRTISRLEFFQAHILLVHAAGVQEEP